MRENTEEINRQLNKIKVFLRKIGIREKKINETMNIAIEEIDYRISRPLRAYKGQVYCTKCDALIIESREYHACPCCGQMYTDIVSYQQTAINKYFHT